ncbi:transcription factor GTE3, chloroplastic-like [Oryza brachyantha]|uniref:Bromo domain-containing protein n=1 Tax=Oryza brachyantha TaxID=4533 RepID=J3L2C7_ORYBR|nr:transcription factor GTE3, chloroplastic-like [Oryza brachyantha]
MPRPKRRRSSLPPPAPPGFPTKRKHRLPALQSAASPGDVGVSADLGDAFVRCGNLLDKLLEHEDGWVFAEPVDARALRLVDYYLYISDPMDLGTVRHRLERRRYADPWAFAADIRLTFRNAMSYNSPGDPVYESAAELSDIFESEWPSVLAAPPRPPDAERKRRLSDLLPWLPVAAQVMVAEIMKKRDCCLREVNGMMEVDLDKADAATLDELDRLVAEHGAALAPWLR